MARIRITSVCRYCGINFHISPSKIKQGGGIYCSKPCYSQGKTKPAAVRLWRHVNKTDSCWLWVGASDLKGYGTMMNDKGRLQRVHRISYEIAYGDIPEGLHVCHKCDNPPCVRPDHLFLGSNYENRQDSVNKRRQACGERSGTSKLTQAQVRQIRQQREQGIPVRKIAPTFGVCEATVFDIISRKRWKHIE